MAGRSLVPRHSALIIACLIFTAPSFAQDNHKSHIPVPPAEEINPELFRRKILEAQQRAGLGDLLKQLGRDGVIDQQQLLTFLQRYPNVDNMLGRLEANDPEITNRLREVLEGARRSGQVPGGLTPEAAEHWLKQLRQSMPGGFPPPPATGALPAAPPGPRPSQPPDPAEQAARRNIARHLADLAQRFRRDELPDSVRNSPAVQDFFHRLGETASEGLRNANSEGLDAQLAKFQRRWESFKGMLPRQVSEGFKKLRMPDLSGVSQRLQVPKFEVSAPIAPAMPRLGGGSIGEFGPAANLALVTIGIAVLAGVLWRLRAARSEAGGGRRPLGPWPLDPAGIASRADLIRAFEYLSLLRCGEPARAWHHRAIAHCLGGKESDRRAAAEQLAGLYEQARYAPAVAPEPDWTAARGPLTFLAGAT
jgi:hypothetical protein